MRKFVQIRWVAIVFLGCSWGPQPGTQIQPNDEAARNAKVGGVDPFGEAVTKVVYLDQGWSPQGSLQFYFTSQGSQILPYEWFLVLEQPDSQKLFRDPQNLSRFRYLTQNPDALNPDGLPVGFVKDNGRDRAWLGFTCAACHTAQINLQNVGYRIDGGPAMADVQGFLAALTLSLKETQEQEPKFLRFAGGILREQNNANGRKILKDQLKLIIDRRQGYNTRNFPSNAPPGYGRVDAFGAILNEVYHQAVKDPAGATGTANTKPADAPVSYPFLWDTPQHDLVQWNGVAKNAGLGSLGRNVGEVLGVFGDLEIPDQPGVTGYASSVQVQNLVKIEEWLKTLWSPQWPAAFPPIDPVKREKGRVVYAGEKAKCNACHAMIDRKDPGRRIKAVMIAVGTEAQMDDNFARRTGDSGKLEGAFQNVIRLPLIGPTVIGANVSGNDILAHTVIGTLIGSAFPAPPDELTKIEYRRRILFMAMTLPAAVQGGTYKARPLNGIWATAPYLHNGSIASLYQLLRPKDRLKSFTVGTRQFDPVQVGFRTDAPGFPKFQVEGPDGRPIPGNSNAGHEFGWDLSDDECWQLVEYLKSL
jgi:hypothetical protein